MKKVAYAARKVAGKYTLYVLLRQNGFYAVAVVRSGEVSFCRLPIGVNAVSLFVKLLRGRVTPSVLCEVVAEQ